IPRQKKIKFGDNGKYIVLYGLQDPGNVGMIIRTADALGMDNVIMSDSCDLYSPKVIRSTMGSVFRTDIFIENNTENLFSMLESNKVITSAGVIDGETSLTDCTFTGKHAVFVGNEGNGLPHEVSARCDRRVTIPMQGNINSLNVAMASGILMWEMQRSTD
ncbi:MAG: RNA methyltransferase, partial [Ruminococcus sp.]|nr:RNA methyltransferase [Ruminococcus sp.]